MAHRALVAYERSDGTYDLHYSHWGGEYLELARTITSATPYGAYPGPSRTSVDPDPIATTLAFDVIITGYVDFLTHEAVYTVSRSFEVTPYRTLWFDLEYDSDAAGPSPTIGYGALVAVAPPDPFEDGAILGRFRGTKDVLSDLLDRGIISEREATAWLDRYIRSWRLDGYEVIFGNAVSERDR